MPRLNKICLSICLVTLIFLALTSVTIADKGQVRPYPVHLAEESQKAIILHNQDEEILILGTALKADQEMGVLEFIPFPAEPTVSLTKGNPFSALQVLISRKKLQFVRISKAGGYTVPVEIKFAAQIGLHDVTVIKINNLEGFSKWVTNFFRNKGIKVQNNLNNVYENAGDYLQRGFNYFVFDYVLLKKDEKFVAPLVYRFKSPELYYPLKTSNITGGEGGVDLALILPGSFGLLKGHSDLFKLRDLFNNFYELSSSAKVYPDELQAIYPKAEGFFNDSKIYLQILRFSGSYEFKDDLRLDISNIAPYAYKNIIFRPDYSNYPRGSYLLAEPLSPAEKNDIMEAYAHKRPEWLFEPMIMEAINGSAVQDSIPINPEEKDDK